jgi:hypothetical protein
LGIEVIFVLSGVNLFANTLSKTLKSFPPSFLYPYVLSTFRNELLEQSELAITNSGGPTFGELRKKHGALA